jgi:prevent-host-death family protein
MHRSRRRFFYLAFLNRLPLSLLPTTLSPEQQISPVAKRAITSLMAQIEAAGFDHDMSAREAKNAFGLMIDTARAEPVLIEKHGRGVEVVISMKEYVCLFMHNSNAEKAVEQVGEVERR